MQDVFADGFANIAVTGTLVRIDLATLRAPGGPNQQPQLEVSQRLVMPLDGFLRAFGMSEQVVQKMVADGIIQKREPQAAAATDEPAAAPAELKSPNFTN